MTTGQHQPAWLRAIIPALILSGIFSLVINSWVEPYSMGNNFHYYSRDLFKFISSRALAGTIAHGLGLSAEGFLIFMRLFIPVWIFLLCLSLFAALRGFFLPFLLSVLFTFNSLTFLSNAIGGFVDMLSAVWILIGTVSVLYAPEHKNLKSYLLLTIATLCFILAILTHEKNLFTIIPIMGWALFRHKAKAIPFLLILIFFTPAYLYLIRNMNTYGHTIIHYLDILSNAYNYVTTRSFDGMGIFTSIGMLWVLFIMLGIQAVRLAPSKEKWGYAVFLITSLIFNLMPLLVAGDTQRM